MSEQERVEPGDESRFRRTLRRRWLAAVFAVAVLVYIVLLIAENARRVTVHYVFGTSHTRLIWLIALVWVLGWLAGIATSAIVRHRGRQPH